MKSPLTLDVRKWPYYPIEMPVTKEGCGPATVGKDAAKITYEVWDWNYNSQGSYDSMPDAINEAMRLSIEDLTETSTSQGDSMPTMVLVNGQTMFVNQLNELSDDDLISLIVAASQEAKDRIGRCDLCGTKHSSFNLCPDPSKPTIVIPQPNEFETKLKQAMKGK